MMQMATEEDIPINKGVHVFEVAVAITDVSEYLNNGGDVAYAADYLNYLSDRLHSVAVLVE
jgi:hypothetical protein